MAVEFQELRKYRLFHVNGQDYSKNSSRTARELMTGRIVWFRQDQLVHLIAY